jgi:hypothetical protein
MPTVAPTLNDLVKFSAVQVNTDYVLILVTRPLFSLLTTH